jgi:hypothetical protein
MNLFNPKPIFLLAGCLLAGTVGFGFSSSENQNPGKSQLNYRDVISTDGAYIAVTRGGRIDRISENGAIIQSRQMKTEELKSILVSNRQLIVAGTHGAIYEIENSASEPKYIGTIDSVHCLVSFRDLIIGGCNKGKLQIRSTGDQKKEIRLDLKGNIVSLSSGTTECYGVTDEGEIIHSDDGKNWTLFDFNAVYKGYYSSAVFKEVLVTPKQIAVVGKNAEGAPVLFFSSKGNVWTQRPLNYTDEEGYYTPLEEIPKDIAYDSLNDQFILLCSEGRLLTIPSCAHCNRIYEIPGKNLTAISGNEHAVIVVGENGYFKIIKTDVL